MHSYNPIYLIGVEHLAGLGTHPSDNYCDGDECGDFYADYDHLNSREMQRMESQSHEK